MRECGFEPFERDDGLWDIEAQIVDTKTYAYDEPFRGRREVGEGFGVPLILRYVLQTCETVEDACDALARVPVWTGHPTLLALGARDPNALPAKQSTATLAFLGRAVAAALAR